MRKKPARHLKKHFRKYKKHLGFVTILLLFIIIALALLLTGSYLTGKDLSTPVPGAPGIPVTPAISGQQQNLQLKTFGFTTPEPTKTCAYDSEMSGCSCPDTSKWGNFYTDKPEEVCSSTNNCPFVQLCKDTCGWNSIQCVIPDTLAGNPIGPRPDHGYAINCQVIGTLLQSGKTLCVGKPVIYLYPEKSTLVDVTLEIPGEIYISIPKYPTEGWKNVLAQPSGTLTYQGQNYHELYYESKVKSNIKPTTGIIIPSSLLAEKLFELTGKLGLKPTEQKEFLEYWLPKLKALNKPYILFSVLTRAEKESIDHVDINPKPDVFINFLAYFKGLDLPVAIEPLIIPPQPTRTGFTAVEWGGTIDSD